jgi:CheY-like chemotaxis protein
VYHHIDQEASYLEICDNLVDEQKAVSKFSKLNVLVIEDNILHITLLLENLTIDLGIPEFNITCAHDGLEAIEAIECNVQKNKKDSGQKLFNLILTDY